MHEKSDTVIWRMKDANGQDLRRIDDETIALTVTIYKIVYKDFARVYTD